jgi:glycosyltransferase involved in cell wall biosynthesis
MSANHVMAHGSTGASHLAGMGRLDRIVVAHAATYGGMLTNFGRLFAEKVVEEGGRLHFFASTTPICGSPPPTNEFSEIGGDFHGLRIPRLPSPILDLIAVVKMAAELRRLKVQVLHTRSSVMGLLGGIAGRLARVPVIIHHQDDLYWRVGKLTPAARWLVGQTEVAISTLSHMSVFISNAVLRDALTLGFNPKRCLNVGLDLNPVFRNAALRASPGKGARHPLLHALGIPESVLVVGSVGRLVTQKGFDTLLRVAKEVCQTFPDCVFLIRGDGPLRASLQAMISRFGLSGRVVLCTDILPRNEVPLLYRSFDVFVLPTRREGFGMVFAEAMALGVPVVGPNMEPVTEVVGPGCGILVEPEDVEQYCGAILRLLQDAALRHGMGEAAREYALKTWGGEAAADRVIQVYCDLIRSRGLTVGAAA